MQQYIEPHIVFCLLVINPVSGCLQWQTHNGLLIINPVSGCLQWQTHNGLLIINLVSGCLQWQTHNGLLIINPVSGSLQWQTHNGLLINPVSGSLQWQAHNGFSHCWQNTKWKRHTRIAEELNVLYVTVPSLFSNLTLHYSFNIICLYVSIHLK